MHFNVYLSHNKLYTWHVSSYEINQVVMKIFLLSTDQTSQFFGGVVSGVVGGGVMLIVIIAMVIITIIVYQKYKPVSFRYRSKTGI